MPKQKTHPQAIINETNAPDATSAQRGRKGRDENVIAAFDPIEHGYTVMVVPAREESEAAKRGLMTIREAADFLIEDESAID